MAILVLRGGGGGGSPLTGDAQEDCWTEKWIDRIVYLNTALIKVGQREVRRRRWL